MALLPQRRVDDVLLEPRHPGPLRDPPISLAIPRPRHGVHQAELCPQNLADADGEDDQGSDAQAPPQEIPEKHILRLVDTV